MSILPPIIFLEPPDWQRRRLAEWMGEWALDVQLRAVQDPPAQRYPEEPPPTAPEVSQGLVRPFDELIEVGQIRLLSPALVPDADRPVYVALFGLWDDGVFLVAPFSRFATPATPGEWLTGRESPPLQVLALWNSRTVPASALKKSWLIDELTEAERAAARAVFEHMIAGEILPESCAENVGPPVFHPQDPRLRYQAEETELFAPWDALYDQGPKEPEPGVVGAEQSMVTAVTPWPAEIRFVEEPAFAAWRKRRYAEFRRQYAGLASDDQRVFCLLWDGDLDALRRAVPSNELPGGHAFTASTIDEPQDDPDRPGRCLARWRIEDAEARRRLRDRTVFYVIRGEPTGQASRVIGRGSVRRRGESVVAILELGAWADFHGVQTATLLFPGVG